MRTRVWKLGGVLLLAVGPLIGAVVAPNPRPATRALSEENPFPGRIWKCPGHGGEAVPELVIPGETSNVPEYHDCQRFIVRNPMTGGLRYDSLYAVFVHKDAKRLVDSLRKLECTVAPTDTTESTGGGAVPSPMLSDTGIARTLPDLVVVTPNLTQPGNCRTLPNARWKPVGIAFVEIVSWGGNYSRLGIKPNFNCLYLWDSAALKGIMINVGMNEQACAHPINAPRAIRAGVGDTLSVRVLSRKGLGPDDYPPVARWDADPVNGGMYVGVYCDGKWCEVGKLGTRSSQQQRSSSVDPVVKRVVEVKGWYDEQILGEIGPDGKLRPSSVRGLMFPHPDLHSYGPGSFTPGTWLPTAYIIISRDHSKYKTSMNLNAYSLPAGTNHAYLCMGTAAQCVPSNALAQLSGYCNAYPAAEVRYYAKIISSTGDVRYRCAGSFAHSGLSQRIPGTVRWRWLDDDEGGWWRCPSGCCWPS